jgi:hypothetical protein
MMHDNGTHAGGAAFRKRLGRLIAEDRDLAD